MRTNISFTRNTTHKRGGWDVSVRSDEHGCLIDKCLTDGEALEVWIAVSRNEKPPYLMTPEQFRRLEERHIERVAENKKMTAREWWYRSYRLMRIARRESLKAYIDVTLYGTGVVKMPPSGEAEHVPIKEFLIDQEK